VRLAQKRREEVACILSNQNRKISFRKVEYKKEILIGLIILVMLSTTFLVQACLTPTKPAGQYILSLTAKQHFSTITLTACLTVTEEHHERGRTFYDKEDVAGALIHFYTCNSGGGNRREIGHSVTRHDGIATFCWSATHNGDYWFVAEYVSNTNEKHNGHS